MFSLRCKLADFSLIESKFSFVKNHPYKKLSPFSLNENKQEAEKKTCHKMGRKTRYKQKISDLLEIQENDFHILRLVLQIFKSLKSLKHMSRDTHFESKILYFLLSESFI